MSYNVPVPAGLSAHEIWEQKYKFTTQKLHLSNPGVTDLLPVKSEKLKDQKSALKA